MGIFQKLLYGFIKFCLILFFIPQYSCNTTEPPTPPDEPTPELTLELEDVSCTESWINLTTKDLTLPAELTLKQYNPSGDSISKSFLLNSQDTLLYIDSLLPNQTYKFKLSGIRNPASGINSNELNVITMDTTSHNFTFQTWTFGTIGSSSLYDVAIIDENNIIAVGEIMVADSSPNGYTTYNAVHWDGNQWKLHRIMFYTFCPTGTGSGSYPTRAVFAIDNETIIVASGSQVAYLKNGIQTKRECIPATVNKIWGTSSNDLYVVGNNGNIAHYNGSQWRKIESGTSLILSDIQANNRGEIFICGLEISTVDGIIVKSENGTDFNVLVESGNIPSSQLFNPKLSGAISSISIDNSNTLYAAGNLVYQYKFGKWNYLTSLPENYIGGNPGSYYRGYIRRIRSWSANDIWIVGERNTARHFNGLVWQQVGMPYNPQIDLVWRGIDTRNNITVIAGSYNNNAIIMTVKR